MDFLASPPTGLPEPRARTLTQLLVITITFGTHSDNLSPIARKEPQLIHTVALSIKRKYYINKKHAVKIVKIDSNFIVQAIYLRVDKNLHESSIEHACMDESMIMEHRHLCFSLGNGRESWRKPSGRATIGAVLSLFLCLSSSFCVLISPYQGSALMWTGMESGEE